MAHWQYTLSASQANVEAIRLARVATGRERIVIFDGKYHGHVEETMVARHDTGQQDEALGIAPGATRHTRVLRSTTSTSWSASSPRVRSPACCSSGAHELHAAAAAAWLSRRDSQVDTRHRHAAGCR
jgi:4-aminobutyrate aminotransferase-like enzyme